TMSDDTVAANTAVQGGGIYNNRATLAMIRDNVSYNSLRRATASDPVPHLTPVGSGLCNVYNGSVSFDGSTFIGNNFNADGSLGGTSTECDRPAAHVGQRRPKLFRPQSPAPVRAALTGAPAWGAKAAGGNQIPLGPAGAAGAKGKGTPSPKELN